MRRQMWIALTTVIVGLSLLTLAERTPAIAPQGCCICNFCQSDSSLTVCADLAEVGDGTGCADFCFASGCFNVTVAPTMSGTCQDVPACVAAPAFGAPSLGFGGLVLAGLALVGVGLFQVLRLRRG